LAAGFEKHEKRRNDPRFRQADQQRCSCNGLAGGGFLQQSGQPAASLGQMRAVSRMELAEKGGGEGLFS
jgi:hypothetical protein